MTSWRRILPLLLAVSCGSVADLLPTSGAPSLRVEECKQPRLVERLAETPNYFQSDSAFGGFPGGGDQYCGPAAASNSLMWFDENGFDALVPETGNRKRDQYELIRRLGSSMYVGVDPETGASPADMQRGLNRYLERTSYAGAKLRYHGWRTKRRRKKSPHSTFRLDWVKSTLERDGGTALLNVGWYVHDNVSDVYTRIGGHWVTIVGHSCDGKRYDPEYLAVHDPLAPGRGDPKSQFVRLDRIESGTLRGGYSGPPVSAESFYRIASGLPRSAGADVGIIDGAIMLQMPPS